MEKWMDLAKKTGFDEVGVCDPGKLICEEWVREGCAENRCRAYGRNWTCPPACGTLEECSARIHACRCGILLQTIGHMKKSIDSRCYRETEHRHLAQFRTFAAEIRRVYPQALCLGSGGCRICKTCAYPEPCRFPGQACSSMEGYGLFVTRVCRDNGLAYYYGEKTIAYTACVLFAAL